MNGSPDILVIAINYSKNLLGLLFLLLLAFGSVKMFLNQKDLLKYKKFKRIMLVGLIGLVLLLLVFAIVTFKICCV